MRHYWGLVLLAVAFMTGCAERRYYDPYYRDYHVWRRGDEMRYRRYRAERHERYRPFRRLDRQQREEYFRWRHDHERH